MIVDDFMPWCSFVRSLLGTQPELQVVGEVSDGIEAVQKAQELKPDLILLDIGLPRLNGIEVARQIRERLPNLKILFLSQESSPEMMQGALSTGAQGYVVKADAHGELLTAVNAILRSETFISARFTGESFRKAIRIPDTAVPGGETIPESPPQTSGIAHRHEVGFYSDDHCLLDDVTRFIGAALRVGNAAIIAATEAHRESLFLRLHAYGVDTGTAIEQGRYIALDAGETLSAFMINGIPDPVQFEKAFGEGILSAARAAMGAHPRVVVFGECVQLLWAQGNVEAAIQIEKLANGLTRRYDVSILCGYSLGKVQGGMDSRTYARICAEHSAAYSR